MQALQLFREKLNIALDEYTNACRTLVTHGSIFLPNNPRDLSNDVLAELDLFASFEKKTALAKSHLNKARNSLPWLTPINSLPDELLNRIFHYVISDLLGRFEGLIDDCEVPDHPLAISQVCTRWRQVALDSHGLWSHIIISATNQHMSLAEIFTSRSGSLPIRIHAIEPFDGWIITPSGMQSFVSGAGRRMESFELSCYRPEIPGFSDPSFSLLMESLRWASENLTRLVLNDRKIQLNLGNNEYNDEDFASSQHWFIFTIDKSMPTNVVFSQHSSFIELDKDMEDRSEEIFSRIQVLKLDLVYPLWSSRAYHGLTELRLIGPRRLTAILMGSHLANILAESPGLRTLHFGLELSTTEVAPAPVHLEHLEEFLLQSLSFDTQQTVLRLILPGNRPLRMSTTYNEIARDYLPPRAEEEELCRFFKRSNIVQLQVHSPACMDLPRLLPLLPNVQTLSFREAVILGDEDKFGSVSDLCPKLDTLHFTSCLTYLGGFLWLIAEDNIKKVTIWNSRIHEVESDSTEGLRDVLMKSCPNVQILDLSEYERAIKVEGWGEDIETRISSSRKDGYTVY